MNPGREAESDWIAVEVAYATPERQLIVSLNVPRGATAQEAVRRSGIDAEFPGLRAEHEPMGIFSRPLNGKDLPLPDEYVMQPRDRVEIYRPLIADPKQVRRRRVQAQRESGASD